MSDVTPMPGPQIGVRNLGVGVDSVYTWVHTRGMTTNQRSADMDTSDATQILVSEGYDRASVTAAVESLHDEYGNDTWTAEDLDLLRLGLNEQA